MMMMTHIEKTYNMFGSAFGSPSSAKPPISKESNTPDTYSTTPTARPLSPRSETKAQKTTAPLPEVSANPITQFANQLNPQSAIGLNNPPYVFDPQDAEAGTKFLASQGFQTQLQIDQKRMDKALLEGVRQQQLTSEQYVATRLYGPATNFSTPVGLNHLFTT
ncbi:MAG: hypothetical protein ACKO34_07165 [Vampirovibrionales bacterium]